MAAQGPGFDLVHSSGTRDKLPRRFDLRREMRMKKYHIELTDEEKALVEAIDLRISHSNHDEGHTAYKGKPATHSGPPRILERSRRDTRGTSELLERPGPRVAPRLLLKYNIRTRS